MSDHSDLIERLRAACVGHPSASIAWPHRILHEAAAALSSQSLSLSEARAERDEAEAVLHGLFRAPVHLDGCLHKDNARLPCQCGAQDRYRALEARVHKLLRVRDDRPALENGPAALADAHSKNHPEAK